jgi:Protein of unknown function (DUF4019)
MHLRSVVAALCMGLTLSAHADAQREINITSDSAPGWLPTIEQSDAAERTARAYLAAEDAGHAEDAYKFFADLQKKDISLEEFRPNVARLRAQLGAPIERRIVKITWTKDSQAAPIPGVYAAIDLASRFENADRHCGYLILYQPDSGGDFQVMREESNILDNATAADIARKGSQTDVEAVWAKLSANCPNFAGAAAKP